MLTVTYTNYYKLLKYVHKTLYSAQKEKVQNNCHFKRLNRFISVKLIIHDTFFNALAYGP